MDFYDWDTEPEAFKPQINRTYQDIIDTLIKNSLCMPYEASSKQKKAELNSEHSRLRRAFLLLAKDHCKKNQLTPGSEEAFNIFCEANDQAECILWAYAGLPIRTEEKLALSPEQIETKLALTVPPYDLTFHIQKHGKLIHGPQDLSSGVGAYVKGQFKSQEIDRMLLQALTQAEIVAYIHEMIVEKDYWTGKSKLQAAAHPSILGLMWNVFKLISLVWVISVGVMALPLLMPALANGLMWSIGLSLGVFGTLCLLVFGGLLIIDVMKQKPHKKKFQQSILDMCARMTGFYIEFRGDGPFSLSQFKRRVHALADTGVVWPSGLYVLLDDMVERGVRSF